MKYIIFFITRIPSLIPGVIEIPQKFLILDQKLESLIHHVFGDPARLLDHGNACKISFLTSHRSNSFFLRIDVVESITNRAILCPKNRDCLNINNLIINKMPGGLKTYKSMDSISSEDPVEVANFPTEFFNTLHVSGIPPHELKLKVGAIVIL